MSVYDCGDPLIYVPRTLLHTLFRLYETCGEYDCFQEWEEADDQDKEAVKVLNDMWSTQVPLETLVTGTTRVY